MNPNRPISISITRQDGSPHLSMISISTANRRLFPLTNVEASALVELLARASGRPAAFISWSSDSDPRFGPSIPETQEVRPEASGAEETSARLYCTYREEPSEISKALRFAWNSFDICNAYAATSKSQMLPMLSELESNDEDERRVGLDWQNRWYFKTNNGCVALLGGIFGTLRFALRLFFSKNFRSQLMDPFGGPSLQRVTQEVGAHFAKTGHDDSILLQMYCTKALGEQELESLFEEFSIPVTVSTSTESKDH